MNREVNKGVELKVQTDLEPIVSLIGAKENTQGWLLGKIAAELGIEADSILDYELFYVTVRSHQLQALMMSFYQRQDLII